MKIHFALLFVTLIAFVAGQSIIPGIQQGLGAGFDIKIERVRMPLYQYSYDYDQRWRNPYTEDIWTYPDQIYLTEVPKGKIVKESNTFTEYHQYIKTKTESIGIDIGYGFGEKGMIDFGFERSHGHYDEIVKGGTNNFAMENRYSPFYQLDIWPDSELNAHVNGLISSLPDTISTAEDQERYNKFIQSVGTHYCVSAQFGGFLNFTSIFHSELNKRHTMDWVAYQVKLSLTWMEIKIGIDWNRNKSTDKMDEDYRENSKNETECVGGLCAYIDNGEYDKWVESMVKFPGILPAYQIMYPVTELIVGNDVKKETLRKVCVDYIKGKINIPRVD